MPDAYYVVRKGIKPGIYSNWNDCKAQTEGFKNPEFRKFASLEDAKRYLSGDDNAARRINPETVSSSPVINSNVQYSIKVKNWMTMPTKAGSNFTFMQDWNHNRPMPGTEVTGFKIKETKGMVYVRCRLTAFPHTEWEGWIVKSAILSEKQTSLFSSSGQMSGSGAGTMQSRFEVTLLIYRNNRNRYALKITFNRPHKLFAKRLAEKYKAKQQDDIFFFTQIEYYEDILSDCANYKVIVENPENYDYIKVHEYPEPELIYEYPPADWKTQPYEHQRKAYDFGMQRERFMIADQQGLGKSMESIVIAEGKKKQFGYKHCLVICGVNTLKWNWMHEIQEHSHEQGRILGFRRKNIGGAAAKLKDLENIDNISEYFIITNIETVRNDKIYAKLKELCENHVIGMIIVDEFHKAKNAKCKQGQNLMGIQAETMIALTGTPILNSPLELFSCFKWLGYEKLSQFSFDRYYSKREGDHNEKITYRHMDTLKKNLKNIMLRRKKEDALDLPEKIYKDEYVEMGPKQQKLYDQIRDELVDKIGELELSLNPLSKMTRLRQVTGSADLIDSSIAESAKLDRLEELVADYIAEDKKVIVFSQWAQMTDKCLETLAKYKPLCITGDTADNDRIKIVDVFQHNDEAKVIVGTTGAMGTGITLTAAEVVIFMDEPWTDGAKEQAVDRAHRIGTRSTVNVHTIICKDTIDEKVHMVVSMKKGISDVMVDSQTSNASIARFLLGLDETLPTA